MSIPAEHHEPRLEETKRIARVLQIVCLISARPGIWSRRGLAQRFEVSERMIDKDLELIRHGLGYELVRTSGGYRFSREPAIQPVHLGTAEALSLLLAAQQSVATGAADRPTLVAALTRLEDALPPSVARHIRSATSAPQVVEEPTRDRGAVLLLLEQAMAERRRVSISYASASRRGAVTERVIAPYRLTPHFWSWYVVAHDSFRDDVIIFNVDRIRQCVLTASSYEIPGNFELTNYLGSAWGVLRGQARAPEDVVLRFTSDARPWAEEMRWHHSQRVQALTDGGVRVRFHCGITDELVRWILWFGASIVVEEPESLRDAVGRAAEAVVQATKPERSEGGAS